MNAVGSVPLALVVVNGEGVILSTNSTAEAMLKSGEMIQRNNDRLSSCHRDIARHIEDLIRSAMNKREAADFMCTIRRPGKLPILFMTTVPSGQQEAGVAVFISDPNMPAQPSHDALRSAYQLSASEARLCTFLAQGKTLQESASAMRLTTQSARTYLKEIFRKTGARRQCELVHLLLSGPCYVSMRISNEQRPIEALRSQLSPFEE